ncbi:O-antigen ligase family protein [Streptomyces sp. NPDC047315]|uniref:O-antigen ligase family protein n=1 Tax=Streptomyces sp. NPDC047315 TaxID=3155142 RepID=UPI0033D6F431
MMAAPGTRGGTADAMGVAVLGACAAWALISAVGRDARPEGALLAVFAVAAGYACGRISGALLPVSAAAAASLVALVLAIASPEGVPGATAGFAVPPGDTGASAALLAVSAGAACCAATAARRPGARLALWMLAHGVVVTGIFLASPAGVMASSVVLLCAVGAARARRRTALLAGCALVPVVVAATTWAVAEDVLPEGAAASLRSQLTDYRVALWRDAVALMHEDPVRGAGPDRFDQLSVTAQQVAGADGKPHSALFQQAVDQGVVGTALLAMAFGWLLYELWRSPRPTPVVVCAGAALASLAVLALLGNALSFAPVTAGAALLAGLASARVTGPGGGAVAAGRTASTAAADCATR